MATHHFCFSETPFTSRENTTDRFVCIRVQEGGVIATPRLAVSDSVDAIFEIRHDCCRPGQRRIAAIETKIEGDGRNETTAGLHEASLTDHSE